MSTEARDGDGDGVGVEATGPRVNWRAEVGALLALVLVAGLFAGSVWFATRTATGKKLSGYERQEVVAPAVETVTRDIGPAPVLFRWQAVWKGQLVATWNVSGAGDASYDGDYVEDGIANGHPKFTNGTRWLWSGGIESYVLSPGVDDPAYLHGYDATAGALPGNPWSVHAATPPAPTLSESSPPTPPDWPFTFYWDGAAPYYGPGDRMRPVRAIIGGTAYVVFPFYNSGAPGSWGFTFYNEATHEFTTKSLTGPLWTDSHDPGQTMCCYDAGDGASLYLCSGSYLDPDPPYPPSFLFALWDVSATPPTLTDSEVVATLPSIHITPFLQVADDTFRFVCVDGTDVKYYEYVALSGTLTLLGTTTLPALPGGYAQVTGDVYEAGTVTCLDRVDTVLFERDGTVYWMRHCKDGSSPPQHRIVAYALTV